MFLCRQGVPRGDNIDRLLGKCVEQWSQLGEREVVSLKALARPSRSNTVRDFHQLGSIKGVDFAESVQVGCAGHAECFLLHMPCTDVSCDMQTSWSYHDCKARALLDRDVR